MCLILNCVLYYLVITFSSIIITVIGSANHLDLNGIKNLGNGYQGYHQQNSYKFRQQDHHIGMPFVPNVNHQAPPPLPSSQYGGYNPAHNVNYEQDNNQNNDKEPLIYNNNNQDKSSIVINADKQITPTAPIIINRGHGHLKHLSDIIIHDQKCGSPTKIKETKHGLLGLFHKSHIIIIGKDCKEDPKMIPIFAPKVSTPIHLHQQHSTHSYKHYNNDDHWVDESELGHWPQVDHQSFKQHKSFKGPAAVDSVETLIDSHSSEPYSDISHDYGSENLLSKSKTSIRSLWQ